jgi:hypothetical protein
MKRGSWPACAKALRPAVLANPARSRRAGLSAEPSLATALLPSGAQCAIDRAPVALGPMPGRRPPRGFRKGQAPTHRSAPS